MTALPIQGDKEEEFDDEESDNTPNESHTNSNSES